MLRCEGKPDLVKTDSTRRGMAGLLLTTLVLQVVVAGSAAGALALIGGISYAIACLIGALTVVGPFMFAGTTLWLRTSLGRTPHVAALLVAEGGKLLLTIAALVVGIRWLGTQMEWPGFLAGLVGAWVAQWLTVWFTRHG
jgi:F0F1-type ATP synthase assembly protein I